MGKDRARFRATGYPLGRGLEGGMSTERVRFKDTDAPDEVEKADEEDPMKDFRPSDTAVSVIAGPPSKGHRYCRSLLESCP